MAFDTFRAPQTELLEDCVHCGFCLDTCPTYVLWGNEADSPRGRIVLIGEGLRSDEPMSDEMVTHFDRCLGCVQRVFYPDVQRATIATLAAEGFEVFAPQMPECCGALEMHSGEEPAAVTRAEATIAAFNAIDGLDYVVTSAAGCGSAMKEYGELVGTPEAQRFAERVVDVTELLGSVEPRAPRGPVPLKVVYHDACHLAHAQKVREQPRAMLRTIPELELLENPVEPDVCCGSAGVYNLLQPEAGADLGARKARNLLDTGADALAAANPGCAAQLDRHFRDLGRQLPIYHPVELVWRSIRASA